MSFTITPPLPTPHLETFEGASPAANWSTSMFVYPAGSHGNATAVLSDNMSDFNTYSSAIMNKKVGPISASDYLSFDYRIVNNDVGNTAAVPATPSDAIDIWITTDCGENYVYLYTIDNTNHIPTTSPTQVIIPLSAYAGAEISPLFAVYFGYGDYFVDIDNVKIGPQTPPLNLGNDTAICANDTLYLDAGYYSPSATYEWHEVSTPGTLATTQILAVTETGSYYVIVNDGLGNILTDAINITSLTGVNLGNDTTICTNHTLVIQASPGYASYLWNTGATTQSISVDSTGIGLNTVIYSCTATSAGGTCSSVDTVSVTWVNCPGMPEIESGFEVSLFPNPTGGSFSLTTGPSVGPAEISLYDIHGRLLFSGFTDGKNPFRGDLTQYANGVYTLRIHNSRLTQQLKLVKQN